MMEQLRRATKPLEDRMRLMIGRAIVRLVDDATTAQSLQLELLAEETQDAVERLQDYGLSSVPHAGAEALVACTGGLRSHAVAIRVEDRRYRLTGLQTGEVALYDDLGNVVLLGRDRIHVTAVSEARVEAPLVKVLSDDVRLGGDGGAKVARVGDDVDLGTGKIITGSDKVTAA